MLGTTYKTKSKYQFESHTPKNLTIFNKYNSSKIQDSPNFHIDSSKKNSSLHKNPNKQKIRNSDTMKILPINILLSTPSNRKHQIKSNNIFHFMDKVYENEAHLKKKILKKKSMTKNHKNKKLKSKVSFMDLNSSKNQFLTKTSFTNYITKYIKKDNNEAKENAKNDSIGENSKGSDQQSYGYDKKYKIKTFEEDNINNNFDVTKTPSLKRPSKKNYTYINTEGGQTHKSFNSMNERHLLFHGNIDTPIKVKKSKSKTNIKKIRKKPSKLIKEKDKNNNNIVNINYNINVNNDEKNKNKKNKLVTNDNKEQNEKKDNNQKEEKEEKDKKMNTKIEENQILNKTETNKDIDNEIVSNDKKKKKKFYRLNCCIGFLSCLNGNNDN